MLQVVWFKRDLRVQDHAALYNAALRGPVLALYVFEDNYWQLADTSQRQWAFTREALIDLNQQLSFLGGRLNCSSTSVISTLNNLLNIHGMFTLHSHEETGNFWTYERDIAVKQWCAVHQIDWHEYPQIGVRRPNTDRDDWARYWNTWMSEPQLPIPSVNFADISSSALHSSELHAPENLPAVIRCQLPDCLSPQRGGRSHGLAILNDFMQRRGEYYRGSISSPLSAENGCSRLSPYLALGCIGMRELVQKIRVKRRASEGRWKASLSAFESRLWWHCHFIQKLEDQPDMEFRNLHPATEQLNRPFDEDKFNAWKTGNTGWPMVDASMRYLIANGWVNFRMRAMLVSVASYPLALPWQPVAQWLASLFIDYEPGIHYPQIQMQAGTTGINIPRMYNPVLQAQRLDPKGIFVRRWLPELQGVSDQWIFEPWLMPKAQQEKSGCFIGGNYPHPLVDFTQASRIARADLKRIRDQDFFSTSQAIGHKHGSRKRSNIKNPSEKAGTKKARDAGQMTLF